MKASFYTFGGPTIGMGHLYRCVALSKWFERAGSEFKLTFDVQDSDPAGPDAALKLFNEKTPHPARLITPGSVANETSDVIIVDSLNVPRETLQALKSQTKCLVSIDDTGAGRDVADIRVNPLYLGEPILSNVTPGITLDGLEHQIIAPEFSEQPAQFNDQVKNILLLQGGSDPNGLLNRLVEDLIPVMTKYRQINFHVVTGPGASSGAVERNGGDQIVNHVAVKNMPALMKKIDLAISSAGVTPFELSAMGVPGILVTAEKKEVETAGRIADTGAALNLGLYDQSTPEKLAAATQALIDNAERRQHMRDAALRHMPGRGGEILLGHINATLENEARN